MKRYNQNDPAYKGMMIGNSHTTIASSGCLICALCDIASKFHQTKGITPDKAAKEWTFVSLGVISDKAYLSWKSDFEDFRFVWRQHHYMARMIIKDPITGKEDTQENILKKYMSFPKYGVVLQVLTKRGGVHWLAGVNKSIFGWAAADPWDGKMLWNCAGPMGRYKTITGWALVEKKEI